MMFHMSTAVSIQKLSITIDKHSILKDITVELPAGRVIGLLGPSGAGKTTLLRTIVGRQKVTRGSVTALGLPAGATALRSQIGYVTQAASIYGDLTVRENLRYFAAMVGVDRVRIEAILEEVDLKPQAGQVVSTLSGGQKSRVSLAVALLNNPPLLALDEPTVGIDPLLRRDLWAKFQQLAAAGATLIVSSHVMEEAEHCDHLLLMRNGKLLAYGTLNELYDRTGTRDVEDVFMKLEGKA
jgi:ABC-2 type transport system ATP-binding protein